MSRVVAFTGTSTGNVYNVGQLYRSAGETYRAMSDGSFRNVETGRAIVGSSQADHVTFFRTASSLTSGSGGGFGAGGGAGVVGANTSSEARTGGPGNGASSVRGVVAADAKYGIGMAATGQVVIRTGTSLAQISGSAVRSGGMQPGFGEFGEVQDQPLKRVGNGGFTDPGTVTDVGWFKTRHGWGLTYSESAKERTEDDLLQQLAWAARNSIGPAVVRDPIPYPGMPTDGSMRWNFFTQEWLPNERFYREKEVEAEMNDFRENGVLAPLSPKHEWGGDAPWLK